MEAKEINMFDKFCIELMIESYGKDALVEYIKEFEKEEK